MPSRRRASRSDGGKAASLAVADWLSLAAAPTFAVMALLAGMPSGGMPNMAGSAHEMLPLSDMGLMYLLMSAFHSAPWLRLVSGR